MDNISLQKLAHNLSHCLTENQIEEALQIFDVIIFDIERYACCLEFNTSDLEKWKKIYINVCILMQRTVRKPTVTVYQI